MHLNATQGGWARKYAFYSLLFETPDSLSNEKISSIKTLEKLKRIDPGLIGSRKVDEELINKPDLFPESQLDLQFTALGSNGKEILDAALGIDEITIIASSKKERLLESSLSRDIVRTLRRRVFFDKTLGHVDPLAQMGFRHGDKFNRIIQKDLAPREKGELKTSLVNGLKQSLNKD